MFHCSKTQHLPLLLLLRPKRKPQKFGESGEENAAGRSRFRPRNKNKKEETLTAAVDTSANEIPRTAVDIVATPPPPSPTTTSRFQLEDFFGTPESVAASELSAFSPSSARLVEARPASEDISENLILDEVRSRTAAITGKREREREKRRQYCL